MGEIAKLLYKEGDMESYNEAQRAEEVIISHWEQIKAIMQKIFYKDIMNINIEQEEDNGK